MDKCLEFDLPKFKLLWRATKQIHTARERNENALQLVQYLLQGSLDIALIYCFKCYIRNFMEMHCRVNFTLTDQVIEWGKEAGEDIAQAAARCFSVVLHVVTVDTGSWSVVENVYGPDSQGRYPSISLLQLDGHYSSLVRREVHEADHYDFATNTYNPVPTGQAIGYIRHP